MREDGRVDIIRYKDEHKDRWSDYVDKSGASTIAHQIGWRNVMRAGLGHEPRYLLALKNDRIAGVLPVVLLKTFWRTSYMISLPWIDYGGICADDFETEQTLIKEACRISDSEKAQFMELRSMDAGDNDLRIGEDKVTFLLDLQKGPDAIFGDFGAKLRNQIRKSQKSGLTAEFGHAELLPEFYKIFSWKMHNLGTPVWGEIFFKTIFKEFPDSARIILVKKDEKPVASGLVLSFKDRLYVPSAAAYVDALKYCPNHALYWAVINKGIEEECRYFDFGRSKIDSSTFKFKQQWVPTPTTLRWQYYLARARKLPSINPSNPKYNIFINLWKKLPLSAANYLGPKIIRNFP